MSRDSDELARGEWAVLALLAEKPAHGWLLSQQLAPDGEIGQIWSGDRQRVYRAIRKLSDQQLIEAALTEPGQGAHRTVFRPTAPGLTQLERWLQEPVEHIRDVQNTFVLKLVFNQRAGRDAQELLSAQRNLVAAAAESLAMRLRQAEPSSQVHLRLRLETTRALLAFIDDLNNQAATGTQTVRPRQARQAAVAHQSDSGSDGRGDGSGGGRRSGRGRAHAALGGARVSDFSGRVLDDAHAATIILRFGDAGEIVVAAAHVDDPVVAEIALVARETTTSRSASSKR
jgi:PadR family transcriptional regulator AphA